MLISSYFNAHIKYNLTSWFGNLTNATSLIVTIAPAKSFKLVRPQWQGVEHELRVVGS